MARITVEDCIDKFPSRFELVLVASNRARKLHSGETPTLEKDNDKNTVIALREIAQETITVDQLKSDLVEEYQTTSFSEDEELSEIADKDESKNDESNETVNQDSSIETDSLNIEKIDTKIDVTDEKDLDGISDISKEDNNIEIQETDN